MDFKLVGNQLRFEGYPNAIKLIALTDSKAKRLTAFALHRHDLEAALSYLNRMKLIAEKDKELREALWISAIISFMKCFGRNKSRSKLDPGKIFRSRDIPAFEFVSALRHKHIVHDENAFSQSLSFAVLNKQGSPRKIAAINWLTIISATQSDPNFHNLNVLTNKALVWVKKECEKLQTSIRADLNAIDFDALSKRPSPKIRTPAVEDMDKTRGR